MKNRKRINMGTVSHATLRHEDLIPTFIAELRSQRPCSRYHRQLCRDIEHSMKKEDYFDSECANFDLEMLFDAINEYAPLGFYFGAHLGDGSDFGYWLSESFVEDFDGVKVSDLSEVPRSYTGEILHITDHGNLSLYVATRGRIREIWAIV